MSQSHLPVIASKLARLRALLTDLFLFGEVLRTRVKLTVAVEGS